jgi:hypothetical protein
MSDKDPPLEERVANAMAEGDVIDPSLGDLDVPIALSGEPSPAEEIASLRIEILSLRAKVEELEGKLRTFRPVHQPKWDADNYRFTEDEFFDEGR